MQHLWQTHKFIYFIIIILFHIYIEYFFAQRTPKEFYIEKKATARLPNSKVRQQPSKANRKFRFSACPEAWPCSTYCLHLAPSEGAVGPVHQQALRDGGAGFEGAFQQHLLTHKSSDFRTGFNFQGKNIADT